MIPAQEHPMPLTDYRTLGRSGLRVSPFCLGTMTFGTEWNMGVGPEESFALMDAYLERGGNFLDTANIYNKGHSEKIIGDYFNTGPGRGKRDRIVIATKFMGNMFASDPNGGGAGRKAIINQCEHSLRRLQTDYIDLYWAHFQDRHTPIEEMVEAMGRLVQQGKVRYLGLSDHPAWVCAQAQYVSMLKSLTGFIGLQIEYSLLQRTVEAELIPMAMELGMGVTPWSPLRAGVLSGKFRRDSFPKEETRVQPDSQFLTESTYDLVDALVEIAAEVGGSPAQVALRWVQDRPGVSSTIIGARRIEHLLDNLGALGITLTPEQCTKLDDLSDPTLPFPHDFLEKVQAGIHGGMRINGVDAPPWPLQPSDEKDRW
jgi:aryl-alcohol dehydrogenase-like predicted oxidoreductase